MDTMSAFAMGEASRGNPVKVFDWDEAATRIKVADAKSAAAGLEGDWEWTGGPILENGVPVDKMDTYTYLASTWATPELEIDGERIPCWKFADETPGWDAGTYWPQSALDILNG